MLVFLLVRILMFIFLFKIYEAIILIYLDKGEMIIFSFRHIF